MQKFTLPTALLTTSVETGPGGSTLHASGDLDLTTKVQFLVALTPMLTCIRTDAPHADLTGLEFLDSAGLEALVWAFRQLTATGNTLHLRVKDKGQPAHVLRLGRFDRVLHIEFVI